MERRKEVVVSALQFACSDDVATNVDTAERLVRSAHEKGANIILIQELFEGHYFCQAQREDFFQRAKPYKDHPTISRMQKLAKELGVVIPVSFFEEANNAHYNSIAIIDADGTDLGIYRNFHIPDGPGYEEKFYFNPGDTGFKQYVGTNGFRKLLEPWFFKVQNYYFTPLLSALNLKTKVLIHVTIGNASCKAMLALIWDNITEGLAPTQWWYDNEEELNRSIEMAINSWGKSNQIIQTPLNKTTINRQISPIACPSFSLGLTHEMSNTIGKTPTNFKFLMPTNNIPCLVPVTMVQGDIHVKRQSKKSRILCSPYIERATDITKALSRQEKMLGDWVASLQGESEDTIFRAMSSFTAHRYHMESLLPKCMLFAHVIDCWSLILNADEVMRDPQSPFRLFCQTDVAGPYLSDPKISDNDKQLMFSRNMWDSIKESDRTLRSVSLIFLPVVASVHIYLIVVDLRDTYFVIIDNSKTDVPMHIKYGDMPNNIQKCMAQFLHEVKHPKARELPKVGQYRLPMAWRTLSNNVDCGVFTMRHM